MPILFVCVWFCFFACLPALIMQNCQTFPRMSDKQKDKKAKSWGGVAEGDAVVISLGGTSSTAQRALICSRRTEDPCSTEWKKGG